MPVWRVDEFEPVTVVRDSQSLFLIDFSKDDPERFGLRASCSRSGATNADEQPWVVRLEPVGGGGFARADDLYLNEAPSVGYDLPVLEYSWTGSDPYQSDVGFDRTERYYYRAMNGKIHGVFSVNYAEPFGTSWACALRLRYVKYNDGSSRNLATPPRRSTIDG